MAVVGGAGWPSSTRCRRVFAMSMTKETPDFGAVTNFEGDEVTIALRGTSSTGCGLRASAILDAAIDRRPASMVLDVSELDYLGDSWIARHLQRREACSQPWVSR
jgi:hypothetical protein